MKSVSVQFVLSTKWRARYPLVSWYSDETGGMVNIELLWLSIQFFYVDSATFRAPETKEGT